MVYKFFDKKSASLTDNSVSGSGIDNNNNNNNNNGLLLCVIDIFSKYAWVVPLKDKKRC